MALYSILLMLSHDRKEEVDAFILNEDPSVPSMPRPTPLRKSKKRRSETVYTRLRNVFAHDPKNLDETKAEMSRYLAGLISLTKTAIELLSAKP